MNESIRARLESSRKELLDLGRQLVTARVKMKPDFNITIPDVAEPELLYSKTWPSSNSWAPTKPLTTKMTVSKKKSRRLT
jgi:hypothetical protein